MVRGIIELAKVALWRLRHGMPRLELFQRSALPAGRIPAMDFVVGPSKLLAAGGPAPRLRLRRSGTRYSAR